MTEEEAKEKWCPFVRYVAFEWIGDGTDNRGKPLDKNSKPNCLGTNCMAWVDTGEESVVVGEEVNTDNNGYRTVGKAYGYIKTGHCGLIK